VAIEVPEIARVEAIGAAQNAIARGMSFEPGMTYPIIGAAPLRYHSGVGASGMDDRSPGECA